MNPFDLDIRIHQLGSNHPTGAPLTHRISCNVTHLNCNTHGCHTGIQGIHPPNNPYNTTCHTCFK